MKRTLLVVCFLVVVSALAAAVGYQPAGQPADLVLLNGKIVTVEPPPTQAQAIAVRGDRIVALGSTAQIKRHVGPSTQVIDLRGRLVIPGFIEGHGHFTGVGEAQLNLNLMKVKSWDEIVAMVADAVKSAKPGQWIYGRGWHQEKWTKTPQPNVEGFPTHHSLSAVSPNNPVVLTHASGHASFANAKAMELSNLTRDTPSPEGGEILKDAKGEPIGALRETASRLIRRGTGEPKRTAEEEAARARKVLELASQEALAKGITSFQDAGSSPATVSLMKEMIDQGKIGVRLWVMLRGLSNDEYARSLAQYRTIDYGNGHLTVRAIKHSIDGALGPRGAWLLEPYSDKPDSAGLNTTPPDTIRGTAKLAIQHGYQLCVHAIGDRGNREVLDVYEATFKANPDKTGLRWRIEHAQHLHPADIPRFGQLGVVAAMQGVHATSDGPWVEAKLGEQRAREGAYVWQSLMKSGAVIANGTDAPVERVDPIASYYSTVSRMTSEGKKFYPEQAMSRLEALRSYTINGAYAGFEEAIKGSLTPGKLADITVLSKDILTVPEEEIPQAQVVYTIVGGKVQYRKAAS